VGVVRGAAHVARDRVAELAVRCGAGGARPQPGRDRGAVDDARERHGRPQLEAGQRVAAHRARVGRGQDDPAAAALAVGERGFEQPAPDPAALVVRMHPEEAEAPEALAHERERHADDLAVVVGDPRAVRIGPLQVRDPQPPAVCAVLVVV
jgi:hypothetical protein